MKSAASQGGTCQACKVSHLGLTHLRSPSSALSSISVRLVMVCQVSGPESQAGLLDHLLAVWLMPSRSTVVPTKAFCQPYLGTEAKQ